MKILKLLIWILLFQLIIKNFAYSCNFNVKSFGSTPDPQRSSSPKLQFKDNKNNFTVILPIENFCKQQDLKGTAVTLLYIDNGLARITLERHNFNDRNLLKYAILQYGDFRRSKAVEEDKWTGSHFWNLGQQIVGYVAVRNSVNRFEKIELTSALYIQKLMNNSNNLEK